MPGAAAIRSVLRVLEEAAGPGYGDDRGGPAEITPRRALWLPWLRQTAPLALGPRESVLALLRGPT